MDLVSSSDSVPCESSSDEDVEPDDICSKSSVDGLPPATGTISVDFLSMQKENWVTSVAALHNSDLVVSGKKYRYVFLVLDILTFFCQFVLSFTALALMVG